MTHSLDMATSAKREFLERFVAAGGVQCGACTPGIVVTAWALLERNPVLFWQGLSVLLAVALAALLLVWGHR